VEFGGFGILADRRPIRFGGRAFDVLIALLEASGAVVSTDELFSRVRQGRIVDQDRQLGTIAALRKGFSASELIR
jgi:DNA-binding winged helix-turn-helix (wHTH) protein